MKYPSKYPGDGKPVADADAAPSVKSRYRTYSNGEVIPPFSKTSVDIPHEPFQVSLPSSPTSSTPRNSGRIRGAGGSVGEMEEASAFGAPAAGEGAGAAEGAGTGTGAVAGAGGGSEGAV